MSEENGEVFDVVICGCGPTAALLSANLSRLGVKHVVLEREADITTDPRGIVLDEDGIRCVQGVGKYEELLTEVGTALNSFCFIDGSKGFHTTPFLRIRNETITGGTGHVGFMSHKQPSLERHLRNAIDSDFGEVRSQSLVVGIEEDDNFVYVTYQTADSGSRTIRGKFLVGADGKTGFTRKKYLEPRGVMMEKSPKFHYEAVWVALNWRLTLPTPKTHPTFPLWNLGYTPEQVYDLFFPKDFHFICDPNRASVCGRFGKTEDRLWRFEFVVKGDEDPQRMASEEETRKIILPYLRQPGNKLGLQHEVRWPVDCIECIRSRPFSFSARICNKWSVGRVMLCGDAAHVFPPFGGQGIASGFRDAISLAWRLKLAISPTCTNSTSLFRGWYMERKQQLERSLASTIENGNYCNEPSRLKAFIHHWSLWLMQLVPAWRYELELGPRKDGMTKYDYASGMPFLPKYGGGVSFPQVFAATMDGPAPSLPLFTDDAIFAKEKKGIFQVVVLIDSPPELPIVQREISEIPNTVIPSGVIDLAESTYIVHNQAPKMSSESSLLKPTLGLTNVVRVVGAEEYVAAGETEEARSRSFPRPKPLYYDPLRIRKDLGMAARYVIVRWDRMVFANCCDINGFKDALGMVAKVLDTSV